MQYRLESGFTKNLSLTGPTGYRVTLYRKNRDTTDWTPVSDWTARLLKVYGETSKSFGIRAGNNYVATTGILAFGSPYKFDVSTVNVDTRVGGCNEPRGANSPAPGHKPHCNRTNAPPGPEVHPSVVPTCTGELAC